MKTVRFLGGSLKAIADFPHAARREAGFQIDKVQRGHDPDDWKSMRSVGSGAREIRIRDATGAFRVIYVATLGDAVYVLHAFQKKTQSTSKHDIDVTAARYREVASMLRR